MYEIYGRSNCASCTNATNLLESLDELYVYYNIEESDYWLNQFKKEWPGRKTVPAISKYGEKIGGYEDLREWVSKHSTNE